MKPRLILLPTVFAFAGLMAIALAAPSALAQSTALTYQGRLDAAGAPVNGLHDFRFRLFDTASGDAQIGQTLCVDNVGVVSGHFTLSLDFGQQYATTSQRHLQVEVRRDTGLNCTNVAGFVVLAPRQQLTATPLACHAKAAFALDASDGSPASAVFVDSTGNVGIGSTAPVAPLHVAASVPILNLQDSDNAGIGQVGLVSFRNSAGTENAWVGFGSSSNANIHLMNNTPTGNTALGAGGLERVTLKPNGNVGIGTSNPLARLHVANSLNVEGPVGFVSIMGIVRPGTNQLACAMFIDPEGDGVVSGDRKSFREPNPEDPATDIWYVCIEGPEAAMYVRGTATLANGLAVIELPSHFRSLASERGMTVQVTPLSAHSKGLSVIHKSLSGIEVRELGDGTGNYEFDWEVKAVRKRYEDYRVIRPWNEIIPAGADMSEAWQKRLEEMRQRDK